MKFEVILTQRKETGGEDSNPGSAQELNLFIEHERDFDLEARAMGCYYYLPGMGAKIFCL